MSTTPAPRTATVYGGARSVEHVARFLPSNYTAEDADDGMILITGQDVAGWTLEGYVIPRLASGLIYAREND